MVRTIGSALIKFVRCEWSWANRHRGLAGSLVILGLVTPLVLFSCADDADEAQDANVEVEGGESDQAAGAETEVEAEPEVENETEPGSDGEPSDSSVGGAEVAPRFELEGELPLTTEEVNDMISFIETEAGREFHYPPKIVAQQRDAYEEGLDARFADQVEATEDEQEQSARVYQALGLSDQTADELTTNIEAFITSADAINGYYDPDTDALYVPVDVLADDLFRVLLVHELLHALDGQYVDLGALIDELGNSDDPEFVFTRTAVVEGRATAVQTAWMMANGVVPQQPELSDAITAVPPAFVNAVTLPYGFGQGWVAANGGAAGTWDAYDNPPTSSEQVAFPDTPLVEAIVPVETPSADGEVISESPFGVADMLVWFLSDSLQPSPVAVNATLIAADGWAGGTAVLWGDDDESCVRISLAADTPADLDEIETLTRTWADEAEGDVERTVEATEERVTVTGCAPFRS